uniref:Uncharacterized protein n=1 Tax=Anguilla anguilla TaxID=7936 RepID=A0A0E9TVD1_ANGAN
MFASAFPITFLPGKYKL